MQIINHRINTINQLCKVPVEHGIELDVRYHNNDLILHHDPFHHHENPQPDKLENLLKQWLHQGPLILNIKTEGIELACIELMKKYRILNWFFLDLSMPYFSIYSQKAFDKELEGFSSENLATRFSEREDLTYALNFKDKARWLWVDCFTYMPLNAENYSLIKKANFKICLVAPELQKHPLDKTQEFQKILVEENIKIDAVCTKFPELWQDYENKIS